MTDRGYVIHTGSGGTQDRGAERSHGEPPASTRVWNPFRGDRAARARLIRFVLLVVLVAALATLALVFRVDARDLVGYLEAAPVPVPMLAIGGSAILVCAFVPRTVLALVGGTMFGVSTATSYVLPGVTLGAVLAFGIGRLLGRPFMQTRVRGRFGSLEQTLAARGLWAVAAARLLPIAHFGLSNYAFGTTSVGLFRYVLGTLIGIAPGTLAYAALGDATARGDVTHASLAGGAAAVLTVAGLVGSVLLWRRRRPVVAPPPASELVPAVHQ